jgi:hypothetical protein
MLDPEYAGLPNTNLLNWRRPRPITPSEQAEDDREHLGDILDGWLDLADVRLRIDWTDTRPEFRLAPGNASRSNHYLARLLDRPTKPRCMRGMWARLHANTTPRSRTPQLLPRPRL